MPKFLENKLKAEYGADSAVPYKIMNKIGAMKGNQETAKGRAMEAKHDVDSHEPAHLAHHNHMQRMHDSVVHTGRRK